MRATIFERDDVVNLLGWRHTPLSLALFAQRVGLDVGVADFAPAVVVALVDRRVTLIRPVPLVFCTSVSRAEAVVGEFWAAGLGAGAFRFPRYHTHLPRIRQDPQTGYRASGGLGLVSTAYYVTGWFGASHPRLPTPFGGWVHSPLGPYNAVANRPSARDFFWCAVERST